MDDLCAENKIWRELVLGRGKGLSRGSSVSQRKQVIGPQLFFFFQGSRAGECNNCGENKPMDSGRGAIEWRQLNLSSFGLKGGFFYSLI